MVCLTWLSSVGGMEGQVGQALEGGIWTSGTTEGPSSLGSPGSWWPGFGGFIGSW
jgi:hypothetical protein